MAPARTIPSTGYEARLQARAGTWDEPTCGIAAGYLQANLIVLPSKYAQDFAILCARNPVPCPLIACSSTPGDPHSLTSRLPGISKIAADFDVRSDAPRFNVYSDGVLVQKCVPNVTSQWDTDDHVAFLIGCSYSFENALTKAGLPPAQITYGRNVPMYRSNVPLHPAGAFTGATMIVSMRMYRRSEVERVRDVTRPYVSTHGEPVAWGWDGMKALGIEDVDAVDFGEAPVTPEGGAVDRVRENDCQDGFVPVFWGCGVTPQEAVMRAKIPGITIGHAPGYMIVMDVKEDDVLGKI